METEWQTTGSPLSSLPVTEVCMVDDERANFGLQTALFRSSVDFSSLKIAAGKRPASKLPAARAKRSTFRKVEDGVAGLRSNGDADPQDITPLSVE